MYTQAHRRFSHRLPRSLQLAVRLQVGKGFRFTQLGREPFYITACGASRDGYIYIYVTVGRAGPHRAYSLSARKTCSSRVENSLWGGRKKKKKKKSDSLLPEGRNGSSWVSEELPRA